MVVVVAGGSFYDSAPKNQLEIERIRYVIHLCISGSLTIALAR